MLVFNCLWLKKRNPSLLCLADVEELLSALPPRNLATLRHLMQHVGFLLCHQRLLKIRLSTSMGTGPVSTTSIDQLDDPRHILSVLGHVLLRPTWEKITLLAPRETDFKRIMALDRLFEHFNKTPGAVSGHSRSARSVRSKFKLIFFGYSINPSEMRQMTLAWVRNKELSYRTRINTWWLLPI